jgi:hypothetical protein
LNSYRKILLLEKYFEEEIYMGIIHFSEVGVFSHKIKKIDNDITQMIKYFCGDKNIQ